MHSFRIRYIVLGLLVYIQSAFCRTCGSNFDDVPSSSVLATVVFEGVATHVEQIAADPVTTTERDDNNLLVLYNLVQFKVRRLFKGDLPRRPSNPERIANVLVGKFGESRELGDPDRCLAPLVEIGSHHIVFLNSTERTTGVATPLRPRDASDPAEWSVSAPLHYPISAFPVPSSKAVLRQVRDYTCERCASKPKARVSKTKLTVREGKRMQLQCKVTGKPTPSVIWYMDGVAIPEDNKHYTISKTRKGSRLRIRRAVLNDGGQYSCQAVSAAGQSDMATATVSVLPAESAENDYSLDDNANFIVPVKPPKYNSEGFMSKEAHMDQSYPSPSVRAVGSSNMHHVLCEQQTYCLNGGICYRMTSLGQMYCECKEAFAGARCTEKRPDPSVTDVIRTGGTPDMVACNNTCKRRNETASWCKSGHGGDRCQDYDTFHLIKELEKRDSHSQDRTRTITGLIIGAVVLAVIFIASYILAKRKKTEYRKRQAKKRLEQEKATNGSAQPLLVPPPTIPKSRQSTSNPSSSMMDCSVQTDDFLLYDDDASNTSRNALPAYTTNPSDRPSSRHHRGNGLPRQNTAPSRLQAPDPSMLGTRPRLNGTSVTPDLAICRPQNIAVVNAIVEPDHSEPASPEPLMEKPGEEEDKQSDYDNQASDLEVNMESEADVAGLDASGDEADHLMPKGVEPITSSSGSNSDASSSPSSDSSIGEEIALFQQLARNPRVPSTPSHTSQSSLQWPSEFATHPTPPSPSAARFSPTQPPPYTSIVNSTPNHYYRHHNGGSGNLWETNFDPSSEYPYPYDPDPDATVV